MSVSVGRAVVAAACLMWLAGCETTSNSSNPFQIFADASAPKADPAAPDGDTTGSVAKQPDEPFGSPPATPELLGHDPNDDLSSYGLAERHFRKSVELHPRDLESWVGLAAAYDRLRRFDLADRAYRQATRIAGATPEILNNQGFSYMLRGDYKRARATLLAARAKDPASPYIANNLQLLDQSARKRKAVN
jgi:tetratricopeptide (TPR) repeat protein